jgi:hypothetical protein
MLTAFSQRPPKTEPGLLYHLLHQLPDKIGEQLLGMLFWRALQMLNILAPPQGADAGSFMCRHCHVAAVLRLRGVDDFRAHEARLLNGMQVPFSRVNSFANFLS